jgi:membrane associated rhomboid family serine protease
MLDLSNIMTLAIIAGTVLISVLAFQNQSLMETGMHIPSWEHRSKEFYRLLTAGFLHADFMHLAFNMYALYGFGGVVESWFAFKLPFGRSIYLLYYLVAIILANIPTLMKHKHNSGFRSIGASGAVSAVVFSAIVLQPNLKLNIMFIPIPITGYIFGALYLAYSSYASKNNNDNTDHEAHFWGAVVGFVLPIIIQPSLLPRFFDVIRASYGS